MLAYCQAPGYYVEFEHRRQSVGADVAVNLDPGLHLLRAQSLIRFDEHGIGQPRILVDDPILVLTLCFPGVLHEDANVLAVGVDGNQPCNGVDVPVFDHAAEPV
jgi:hypothetical protein